MKNDNQPVVSSKIQTLYRDIVSEEKLSRLFENGMNETLFQNIVPVASINVCDADGTAFYQCLLTGIYPNNPTFMHGLIYNEGSYQFNVISLSYIKQLAKQRNGTIVPDKEFEGIYNMAVYAKVSAEGACGIDVREIEANKSLFKRYAKGKNLDSNQYLSKLHFKLACSW